LFADACARARGYGAACRKRRQAGRPRRRDVAQPSGNRHPLRRVGIARRDHGGPESRFRREGGALRPGSSQSSGIICSSAALPTAEAVVGTLPARPWIMTNTANFAGLPVFPEAPPGKQHSAPAPIGRADDACIIIYTSGTTGYP